MAISIIGCTNTGKPKQTGLTSVNKENVLASIVKVNNKWQAENDVNEQNAFWHPAAYHIGNLAAFQTTQKLEYLEYTVKWAENNQWMGAKSTNPEEWKFSYGETDEYVLFGDWQACFQVYIDLYNMHPEDHKVKRAMEVMQYQVYSNEHRYWWWIDGLYMVMPVMTRMYALTWDELYLQKLYEYFSYTKEQVYDEGTGFFYRDAKYIFPEHKTNTGKKDFWSRGNGWVFAAFARTLEGLPKTEKHYNEYLAIYTQMADALMEAQHPNGYWTRSLLDPEQAPGPETSGTAFFTYGILWGMNNNILDERTYAPVIEKSWNYLSGTAIQSDGVLGFVQPIGENAMPGQEVNQESTSDFGVGAFLLAASEMLTFLEYSSKD